MIRILEQIQVGSLTGSGSGSGYGPETNCKVGSGKKIILNNFSAQ